MSNPINRLSNGLFLIAPPESPVTLSTTAQSISSGWYGINAGTSPVAFDATQGTIASADLTKFYGATKTLTLTAPSNVGTIAANEFAKAYQRIPITTSFQGYRLELQFWAKSSVANQPIGISFIRNFGTGGSPSSQEILLSQSIILSTTWTEYTFTIPIPALNGQVIGSNADGYLELDFYVQAGANFTTFTGGSQIMPLNNQVIQFTQVGLVADSRYQDLISDSAAQSDPSGGGGNVTVNESGVLTEPSAGEFRTSNSIGQETQSGASTLSKWLAKVARLRAGTSTTAVIACIGDSNTAGYGATGATWTGAKALSYPTQMASMLSSAGLPAQESSFFSTNVEIGTTPGNAYDPRISAGAGWTGVPPDHIQTLGGLYFQNSTTTNAFAFTPTQAFDSIEIWYADGASRGVFTVNVDGGATLSTVTGVNPAGVSKASVSCALGVHTVNIARTSGDVWILGVNTYNSTAKTVSMINAGLGTANMANIATGDATYGPAPALLALAPDLTIISAVIVDIFQGNTNVAGFKANLTILVQNALISGSVIIEAPAPFSNAFEPEFLPQYLVAMQEVCNENNCLFVNTYTREISYTSLNALGLRQDALHPNAAGYSDFATMSANFVLQFSVGSVVGPIPNYPTVLTSTPTTGATISFNNNSGFQDYYVTPAGALAALTLNLPSNATSLPGQVLTFLSTEAVASFTVQGATTILNSPAALVGDELIYFKKLASNVWAVNAG